MTELTIMIYVECKENPETQDGYSYLVGRYTHSKHIIPNKHMGSLL